MQNTIDAYQRLQEIALTELYSHPKSYYEDIANDDQSDEYKHYSSLVAECENFAICLNENVYDIDLLLRLSKKHLVHIYDRVFPIIFRAQTHNKYAYSNFEDLAYSIKNNKI